MAFEKMVMNILIFFTIFFSTMTISLSQAGFETQVPKSSIFSSEKIFRWQKGSPTPKNEETQGLKGIISRRLMIGSRAPICTYNECRGCRFKCTAEQVPVDANDPMNSAYHYKCVCHR